MKFGLIYRIGLAAFGVGTAVMCLALAVRAGSSEQAINAGIVAALAYIQIRIDTRLDRK